MRKRNVLLLGAVLIGLLVAGGAQAAPSASSDATLSNLKVSAGVLQFDASAQDYTVFVSSAIPSIDVTPTVNDAHATVTVNGAPAISSHATTESLVPGDNAFDVVVTAEDTTSVTYHLDVRQATSSDADVADLSVKAGGTALALSPVFDPATDAYTLDVPYDADSVDLTATLQDTNASASFDGDDVQSGSTLTKSLDVGENQIGLHVVQSGDERLYLLTITRGGVSLSNLALSAGTLSPAFNPSTTDYSVDVASSVRRIDVTPTSSASDASIWLNGEQPNGSTVSVSVNPGVTTIIVEVTTADDPDGKLYTVRVHRTPSSDASLGDLSVVEAAVSPAFDPATSAYASTVGNDVSVAHFPLGFLDNGARVDFPAGEFSQDGVASINLQVGANIAAFTLTAEDGTTTKTYTVTIVRQAGPPPAAPAAAPAPPAPAILPTLTISPAAPLTTAPRKTKPNALPPVKSPSYSSSATVHLTISAPADAKNVVIANLSDFSDAKTFPVSADGLYSWTVLENGPADGDRHVYVKFGTASGQSTALTTSVKLDDKAPVVSKPSVAKHDGDRITLSIPTADLGSGVAFMQFAPNLNKLWGWAAYTTKSTIRTKQSFIWVRAADAAGNVSAWTKIAFPKAKK